MIRSLLSLILGLLPCLLFGLLLFNQESPGPLSQAHSDLEGAQNCLRCHTPDHKNQENKCLTCHPEIAERISQNKGYHKDKRKDCTSCHLEHQNLKWKLTDIDRKDFDHDETGYILRFSHKEIEDCFSCHRKENTYPREKSRSLLLLKSECVSCHSSPHPGNQDDCRICHIPKSWQVDIWKRRGAL